MGTLTTATTQLGVGGPTKNYARPIGAKAAAVVPVRAITWMGLGGPGLNRTRPLGDKGAAVPVLSVQRIRGFTRNVGRLMNP